MSLDNLSLNQSNQNSQFIRQAKMSSSAVNNELLKNIEILDSENTQLKAALGELQEDLKDKENSIEESHKIITKLKDEYSKLIKEYQNLEQINNDLISENELNKKSSENYKKANDMISKLQKQNNDFCYPKLKHRCCGVFLYIYYLIRFPIAFVMPPPVS